MNDSVDSRRCQTVLDNAPTLIISADRNGVIQFANRDAFGYAREDIRGMTIYEFIPKSHREGLRVIVDEAIRTKSIQLFEFDDSSSGTQNWFRLRIGPVISEGEVESIVLISNVITDQKKAEKELIDSEIKLRSIFNSTLEGIILSDETGNIVEWNKAQEDIFGIRKEEALGRKLWDVQYSMLPEERRTPEAYSGLEESIQKYFETRIAPWLHEVVESNITLANGEPGIIQQFAVPIKTSEGYALCAFIHDITGRRRAEQEKIETEKRYKALFDETNDGVAILDLEGNHLDLNERAAEMLGYAQEDIIGKSIELTVVEDEHEDSRYRLKQLLAGEKLPIYDRMLRKRDGSEVPVEINISLVHDEDGNPNHIQSIMRDISSRKQSEKELKESEQKWRLLAEESIQGITILQDRNIVYTNPAYANIVGRTVDELYSLDNEGIWNIIHPDDREGRKAGIKRYFEKGELAQSSVFRIIRPDGEIRWIDGGVSIIDFGGKPAMQRTAIDVTNRMLAEKAVVAERDRAEIYLQMAGVIFLALDTDGDVTLINRKGTEVLGYSSDEILGKPWFDLIPEEFRHEVKGNFNKIIQGELEQIEYIEREVITKSGEKKLIAWHSGVLKNSEGKITGVISSGEDITEKREAQMELKASQEMLQLVMNNIPQHVFWKDTSSNYLGCNDSFAEVYISGTPEDVIGKTDYNLNIDSEEADRFRSADRFAIESSEKRYDVIERTQLPSGDEAWFRTIKVPLHDADGNEIGILGTLEDVTQKRNAELDLINSERKFRTLMHSMKDLVFVFDENNIYREFYVQNVENLYVPPNEFIGRNIKDVLPQEIGLPFTECVDRVRLSGISETFDYMLPDNGGDRWFSASVSRHEDGNNVVSVIREITARVAAARELEKAYRIINMSPAVAFLWRNDENWPVEYASGNVRDLLGYSADEFMSGSVLYSTVVHPDDIVRVADEVQGFSADSLCQSFVHEPYRIIRKDGEVRWITDDTVIRRNEKGEITHYQGVVTDITNRILMMDALRESESKYRSIIEQSLMGLLIIDSEDRMVRLANPLIAHYIGRSIDDLLSMSMEDLIQIIDHLDLEPSTRFLEKCIRGESPEKIVVRIYRHRGKKVWLLLDGNRVTFEGRNAVQLSVVDITARMEALESLQKERASFRAIAEGAVKASDVTDLSKRVVAGLVESLDFDMGTLRLYDEKTNTLSPTAIEGIEGNKLSTRVECTEEEEKNLLVVRVARSRQPLFVSDVTEDRITKNYIHRLSPLNIKSVIISPIINDKNELLGVLSLGSFTGKQIGEDDPSLFEIINELLVTILERGKTEKAYQMSVRRYRNLLSNMPEGIGVVSLDQKFLFVNESLAELVGYNINELEGNDSALLIHPEDLKLIIAETELRKEGISSAYQIRLVRKDGEVRIVRVSAIPSRDDEGIVEGTVVIVTDITERVKAEQEVRQLNEELVQRVEERTAELQAVNKELEAFAYSVSHDLRAPLRTIDGFSAAILEDYSDDVDATGLDYLHRIRNGAQGMSNLIDAILSLSKVTRLEMDRVDVNLSKLAEEAIIELRETESDRDVGVEIQEDIVMRCDKRSMRVVLQNLIGNAWKYTKNRSDPRIDVGVLQSNGEEVFFVKDNGVGFDPEQKEKLFKPFQRLHRADDFEGTGIGLATVKRVIVRHGGRIWAESQEGMGSTFYFTLKIGTEDA